MDVEGEGSDVLNTGGEKKVENNESGEMVALSGDYGEEDVEESSNENSGDEMDGFNI